MEFVAFDLETTGLLDGTEICEFAFVLFRDGKVVDVLSSQVKPSHTAVWQPAARKINGITKEAVKNKPALVQFKGQIADFLSGQIVFAHNASFDVNRLMSELGLPVEAFCSMRISQSVLNSSSLKQLDDIAKEFGIPKAGQHDAKGDAIACGEVVIRLMNMAGITSRRQLATAFSQAMVSPTHNSVEKAKSGPKNDRALRKVDFAELASTREFGVALSDHFTGRTVIFSELAQLSKLDAQTIILRLGGFSLDNVSKKTDFLVMGDVTKQTTKKKTADRINSAGGSIRIISEGEFIALVEQTGALDTLLA